MKKLITALLFLILFGCLSKVNYEKLAVKYTENDCSMDTFGDELLIVIDEDGDGSYDGKPFTLTEAELSRLMEKINESDFYELEENYDSGGYDFGTCKTLRVQKGNYSKSVFLRNTTPSEAMPEAFLKAEQAVKSAAR